VDSVTSRRRASTSSGRRRPEPASAREASAISGGSHTKCFQFEPRNIRKHLTDRRGPNAWRSAANLANIASLCAFATAMVFSSLLCPPPCAAGRHEFTAPVRTIRLLKCCTLNFLRNIPFGDQSSYSVEISLPV
jgi:hypothetical protein